MENHTLDKTTDGATAHLTNRANNARQVIGHTPELPLIPAKRYFTIGEVSELCGVKAHVLRYWEQEFTQLRPVKRGGNRRYYQHHEVLLIRRIRQLLYEDGFTISGARGRLGQLAEQREVTVRPSAPSLPVNPPELRRELREIINLLQA